MILIIIIIVIIMILIIIIRSSRHNKNVAPVFRKRHGLPARALLMRLSARLFIFLFPYLA